MLEYQVCTPRAVSGVDNPPRGGLERFKVCNVQSREERGEVRRVRRGEVE